MATTPTRYGLAETFANFVPLDFLVRRGGSRPAVRWTCTFAVSTWSFATLEAAHRDPASGPAERTLAENVSRDEERLP